MVRDRTDQAEDLGSRPGFPLTCRWKRLAPGCELQEGSGLTLLFTALALAPRMWPGHRHSLHFLKMSEEMNK